MKKLIPLALLAFALSLPVGALAQLPPGPFMGPEEAQALNLTPQQQQAISQVWSSAHARMHQLEIDNRTQILGTLTPQQRSLLAQVVGNLAIAPNPDPEAAAQQLQSALSPQQAQRIVSLRSSFFQQMHQTMSGAMTQAQSYLTSQQRQKVQQQMSVHFEYGHPELHEKHMGFGPMHPMEAGNPQTEAGRTLLDLGLHGMTMEMGVRFRITNH